MTSATYVRYEIVRTLRNRRFFLFSLGFPLVLYFLVAGPNRNEHDLGGTGISAPLYFMIGLTAFGAMNSVIAGGARIALDRSVGWTRQLRLTPLSPRSYLVTKILTAYLTALITVVVLAAAGTSMGVHLSATRWAETIALLLIGLLPFAALGILFGHLLTVDSLGPAVGGTTALLAFLGGVWFPIQCRLHARRRAGAPVVLARPGEPRRERRARLGHARLGSHRSLGGRPRRRRGLGVPS